MKKVIAWFSGGITSAVACKMAIEMYGVDEVEVVFLDTQNEHPDTYRFLIDCEKWYGTQIQFARNERYESIEAVWDRFNSLNVGTGAICSSELKRAVRLKIQKENPGAIQIFGFDIDEPKRALAMKLNYPDANPEFPLVWRALRKKDCIKIVQDAGLEIPEAYKMGFSNNNCLKTGCVQGGIGYWQKMKKEYPEVFNAMAQREHKFTDIKGEPVTICKDQAKGGGLVFLLPHPDFPSIKDISQMRGREPKSLTECNGFCGTLDLQ